MYSWNHVQNQGFKTTANDLFSEIHVPQLGQLPFSPNSVDLNSTSPLMTLSAERSQEVYEFVRDRFSSREHATSGNSKHKLLEGDRSVDSHIMSRSMMQSHIDCYWKYFHSQLPICRQPAYF